MSQDLSKPPNSSGKALSRAAQPRGIVLVNDIRVKFFDLSINTTTFYLADTFSFKMSLNGQNSILNMAYWASVDVITIKIYVGFPRNPEIFTTSDLDLILIGEVDDFQFDLGSATISMSGRDLSLRFIDTKTTQKFANQTASAIVNQFASEHGIKTRVTNTTTVVGNYYSQQQVMLSSEITQWDLMTYLAQQENFVLFMDADTLVFEPRPDDVNVKNPYIIQYVKPSLLTGSPTINAMGLLCSRSMTIAKDAQVTVRVPHGTKTGKAFSVTVRAKHRPKNNLPNLPKQTTRIQKYSVVKAGLTREQALNYAQHLLQEITRNEINLSCSLPGDNKLKKDSLIQLTGTGTALDQYYYSDSIIRTLSTEQGYMMEVSAKNHSVDSQVSPQ